MVFTLTSTNFFPDLEPTCCCVTFTSSCDGDYEAYEKSPEEIAELLRELKAMIAEKISEWRSLMQKCHTNTRCPAYWRGSDRRWG